MRLRKRKETPDEERERLQREEGQRNHDEHMRRSRKILAERRAAERREKRASRKAARAHQGAGPAPGSLRIPRMVALVAVAVVVGAADLTSFSESYRGLFDWAHEHGLSGLWAAAWPLQVDTFIVVGELALFVALADRWTGRQRFGAWATALAGLAVSVAGNVGHVHSHLLSDRATAAVPPLAAFAALWVGLGVLKRVVGQHHARATAASGGRAKAKATPKAGAKSSAGGVDAATRAAIEAITQGQPVPSARALARTHHIGRDKAGEVRALVLANGHQAS